MGAGRIMNRTCMHAPFVIAALLLVLGITAQPPARAASSNISVGLTVRSATEIDADGCDGGAAGVTEFGTVLPGAKAVSSGDCTVGFGSSNDRARLGIVQEDADGAALNLHAWRALPFGVTSQAEDVVAIDARTAWVVGEGGMIRTTTDGGASWIGQASGTGNRLLDVDSLDGVTGWAVGIGGLVLKTVDGGATWSTKPSGTGGGLIGLDAVDGQVVYAAGNDGTIIKSTDGGETWSTQVSGGGGWFNSVSMADASTGWAVGGSGTILRTTNGGATWTAQASGTGSELQNVEAWSATTVYAVGNDGTVLTTTNGGSTWVSRNAGTTQLLVDVSVIDADSALVVGFEGTIRVTHDGGATWSVQAAGTTDDLRGADAPFSNVFWAVGEWGAVIRTPADPISDYVDAGGAGDADWTTGPSTFGACLRSLTGTAVSATWTVHATCPATDGAYWRGVGTTASTIAQTTSPGSTDAVANLRFGVRLGASQAPGRYTAPVVFEVVAPA